MYQRYSRNSDGVTPCGGAKQRWGMIKPAIFQKHGASINRSIQRAVNLVRRSTAINTSRPRSVYLPLILISSQMNTEKWNMNIHFHVHQPRSSSSKHVHVLAIQILSVCLSVTRWYCIKTAERSHDFFTTR